MKPFNRIAIHHQQQKRKKELFKHIILNHVCKICDKYSISNGKKKHIFIYRNVKYLRNVNEWQIFCLWILFRDTKKESECERKTTALTTVVRRTHLECTHTSQANKNGSWRFRCICTYISSIDSKRFMAFENLSSAISLRLRCRRRFCNKVTSLHKWSRSYVRKAPDTTYIVNASRKKIHLYVWMRKNL